MFFLATQAEADGGVTTANVQERFPSLVDGITGDVGGILPELILCVGVMWVLMVDLFGRRERSHAIGYHALAFIVLALVAVLQRGFSGSGELFRGMIVDDGFGAFVKVLLLGGTAICIPMIMMQKSFAGRRMGEFYALLLGSVVGMFLMATAKNMLMFFLGIEFASYTSYLLTTYLKDDRRAGEGGLKYVIYGSVASGAMIYGLSLIYGLTGSMDIAEIANTLVVERTTDMTVMVASILALAGFAYKMSAFPMHFWSPDVYQGAPVPFTAFLSVISKAAGFAVFIRFVWAFTNGGSYELDLPGGAVIEMNWPILIGVVAAASMCVGNFAALFQDNLKRLLAYSSIAHAGYLLMGVAALYPTATGATPGWGPVLFYLLIYLFMNLGAFLVVAILENRLGKDSIDGCRGLGARNPILAVSLLIFLISLIGLPPTAGFSGKVLLLKAVLQSDMTWLAIVAVINTVISVYYYARIIKMMFLEKSDEAARLILPRGVMTFVMLMVVPIFYLFLFWDPTIQFIEGLELTLG